MYLPFVALLLSGWPASTLAHRVAAGRTPSISALETTTSHAAFAQTDWQYLPPAEASLRYAKREAPQSSDVILSDMLPWASATGSSATINPAVQSSPSSGVPSPPGTAVPTGTGNTSALALARSLLEVSTPACLSPGGGCAVLNLTLPQCLDDTCACADETTLAAMVCTQCNAATAADESVGTYNTYLGLCEQMGIAAPSDTLAVSVAVTMSTSTSTSASASASPSGGGTGIGESVVVAGLHATASAGPQSASPIAAPATSGNASGVASPSNSDPLADSSRVLTSSSGGGQDPGASPSSGGPAVGLVTAMPTPAAPSVVTVSPGLAAPEGTGPPSSDTEGVSGSDLDPSLAGAGLQLDTGTSTPGLAANTSRAAVALLATDMSDPTASTSSGLTALLTPTALGSGPSAPTPSSGSGPIGVGVGNSHADLAGPSYAYNTLTSMSTMLLSPSAGLISVSGTAGLQGDTQNSTSPTATEVTATAALNASVEFFGYEINAKCDTDCADWKELAGTCTKDACICTGAAILSAGACSACLGSTTHGETYQRQIGFYNGFTANCSAIGSGSSQSSSSKTGQYGYEEVPAATSSRLGLAQGGSGSTRLAAGQASRTAVAAEEAVVTQYADANAGRPSISVPAGWAVWLRLVASGIVILAGTAVW